MFVSERRVPRWITVNLPFNRHPLNGEWLFVVLASRRGFFQRLYESLSFRKTRFFFIFIAENYIPRRPPREPARNRFARRSRFLNKIFFLSFLLLMKTSNLINWLINHRTVWLDAREEVEESEMSANCAKIVKHSLHRSEHNEIYDGILSWRRKNYGKVLHRRWCLSVDFVNFLSEAAHEVKGAKTRADMLSIDPTSI